MKQRAVWSILALLITTGLLGLVPGPATAALHAYGNKVAFLSAYPAFGSLVGEDFEAGVINTGFASPLNSSSTNAAFVAGDILPGVAFSTDAPAGSVDLIVLDGTAVSGLASKTLVTNFNFLSQRLIIDFTSPGVSLAGFDYYVLTQVLQAANTHCNVYVNGSSTPAGQFAVSSSTTGPSFFGVATDGEEITRITVHGYVEDYYNLEGIDNVAFGAVPVPPAVVLLGSGLLGLLAGRRLFR